MAVDGRGIEEHRVGMGGRGTQDATGLSESGKVQRILQSSSA